jgi:hypothetical protein
MTFVSQFRGQTTCLMLLALLGVIGCNEPASVPGDESSAPTDHQAPFHDEASKSIPSSSAKLLNASDQGAKPDNLPFQEENLPAGTLVTVSLKSAISGGSSGMHNTFEAVVDEPVAIEGNTLITRGTIVSGRVQSVRTSKVEPDRGYICLAMSSIRVGGIDVPVQTADLYARQSQTANKSSSVIRLEKGRRLTFRLTEPAYVSSQRAQSAH